MYSSEVTCCAIYKKLYKMHNINKTKVLKIIIDIKGNFRTRITLVNNKTVK